MDEPEYKLFRATKTAFIILMGVGYLTRPKLVRGNYGVSNFWFKKRSRIPYVGGFAINALGTLLVASRLFGKGRPKLAASLAAKSALVASVLLTSKYLDTKLSKLHYGAGGAMYGAQVLISGWLVLGKKSLKNLGLFGLELAGTGLNLVSAMGKTQQMFVGQVLAQAGYLGILLGILRPRR
ncbi:MAG TPA: hypothetical protein VFP35_00155 [Candidatus Saccharimonadales bacterium]|nr:hypothetical protein [Candidatus Saccharimonadales bacterium]